MGLMLISKDSSVEQSYKANLVESPQVVQEFFKIQDGSYVCHEIYGSLTFGNPEDTNASKS